MTAPPLWLYLDFPLLPLELGYAEDDERPAALCAPHGGRLQLCNARAAAAGVKPGMPLASASALCPNLQLYRPQPEQERQQLQALALWAGRFSARIAPDPPCGLLLEIASMLHYFGTLSALHQQLRDALAALRFSARSAYGHTPGCARLLARHDAVTGHAQSEHNDYDALRNRLLQLPVQALELPAAQRQQLIGMGLTRLEQLLALPRDALRARFDASLLDYLDRLVGRLPDPPRYQDPPACFRRRLELNHEVESSLALLFPLKRLLAELEGFLYQRQQHAAALQLTLEGRDRQPQPLALDHRQGEWRSERWLELWRLRLERLQLPQPVLVLELSATRLGAHPGQHRNLFDEVAPEQSQQLLNRLRSRLGDSALYGLALQADHRPERSWQALREPPADSRSDNGSDNAGGTPSAFTDAPSPLRPSWLVDPPRALGDRPDALQIELVRGPERISSGWWDGAAVRRDYYLGRWPDGRLGWLYCDAERRWHLHGWFG